MERFCRDCRHVRLSEGKKFTCASPRNFVVHVPREIFLVTGVMPNTIRVPRAGTCAALRVDRGPDMNAVTCGPEGKWWEAKESA